MAATFVTDLSIPEYCIRIFPIICILVAHDLELLTFTHAPWYTYSRLRWWVNRCFAQPGSITALCLLLARKHGGWQLHRIASLFVVWERAKVYILPSLYPKLELH